MYKEKTKNKKINNKQKYKYLSNYGGREGSYRITKLESRNIVFLFWWGAVIIHVSIITFFVYKGGMPE